MRGIHMPTLYWSLLMFEEWNLYIASTSEGLVFVGSHNQPFEELLQWAKKRFPDSALVEDGRKLEPYMIELKEYLVGKRKNVTFPIKYNGTAFQISIWKALCNIPYGQTRTYSDIARSINKPQAVRAVGAAIGANPVLIAVPCHRVIGKNGKLTGYRGGIEMKKWLLALENK